MVRTHSTSAPDAMDTGADAVRPNRSNHRTQCWDGIPNDTWGVEEADGGDFAQTDSVPRIFTIRPAIITTNVEGGIEGVQFLSWNQVEIE